jgi:hypothetical protein
MHALWRSIRTARWVLAAYWLVVAVGLLSPMLAQADLQVVCHGGAGVKLVVVGDDDSEQATSSAASACPLCQTVAPPPVLALVPSAVVPPLAHAATPAVIARLHALAGAPLPARGPPRS